VEIRRVDGGDPDGPLGTLCGPEVNGAVAAAFTALVDDPANPRGDPRALPPRGRGSLVVGG